MRLCAGQLRYQELPVRQYKCKWRESGVGGVVQKQQEDWSTGITKPPSIQSSSLVFLWWGHHARVSGRFRKRKLIICCEFPPLCEVVLMTTHVARMCGLGPMRVCSDKTDSLNRFILLSLIYISLLLFINRKKVSGPECAFSLHSSSCGLVLPLGQWLRSQEAAIMII